MGRKFRNLISLALGGLLATLVVALGCAPKAPAEEKYITFAGAYDMTGPAAPHFAPCAEAMQLYVKYFNEELGGYKGVKIRLIATDTAGLAMDPWVGSYKRARDIDNALVWFASFSSALDAVTPMAAEDHMPFGFAIAEPGPVFVKDSYYFATYASVWNTNSSLLQYWFEKEWKGQGKPKVASYGQNSASTVNSDRFLKDWTSRRDIPFKNVLTSPAIADASPYALEMKEWKPDIIILTYSSPFPLFVKEARKVGLNVPIIDGTCAISSAAIKTAAGEAAAGILSGSWLYMWDDVDQPGIKLIHKIVEESRGPGKTEERMGFYAGWAGISMATEGLKRALDKVGYEGLTGDIKKGRVTLKDTLEAVKNVTAGGVTGPISYAPGNHLGITGMKLYRITPTLGVETIAKWGPIVPLRPEQMTAEWWKQ